MGVHRVGKITPSGSHPQNNTLSSHPQNNTLSSHPLYTTSYFYRRVDLYISFIAWPFNDAFWHLVDEDLKKN